ncbi:response regulator transcription factor [Methylovulum psychrotolerans]|jgi:two-component system response regulator PhoP|uniref:DNA-binding response regulator n=1 Tax=Methylovulum psychrotolerans TaxID=1704499 RepID=A0A1Z4C450_9GAMM|nr:response regulator transcription factor [Methylovulum psychrotolerans]ASF48326.1 DNA-binding response regulator [Methylovulum psychrotolerans]MBT9096833.1 response regulator transcription factor [Methylovulum psychrotolerans]POZ51052.1 DNA-binding response regulator [Methylovulum psychrotolerans]
MRILIIEDETDIRSQIRRQLEKEGYRIDETGDGLEGLYFAQEYPVDAAIIDLGLPRLSGLDIIKRLRGQGSTLPVLVLTARGRWQERVEGLEAGADDYLAKPFQMEELSARLKALLRRVVGAPQSLLDCGYLVLNLATQRVTMDGQLIELTGFEYRMLEYLAQQQGKIVSKDDLVDYLYPHDTDPESNVLTVLVGRLRRKLDPDGLRNPIETLRGRGYRLV